MKTVKLWLVVMLQLLLLTSPAVGLAQTAAPGTGIGAIAQAAQRSNDKSRQALVSVFGQVVNDPLAKGSAGGGDTILASIFQKTNAALLTIGGFICGWGAFRRVASAANSGSFFDQAGNSLWAPLRIVWGVSSLVPTANGWSLSQLVMLWAASIMGVGTANLAVDAAATALQNGTPLVMSPVMPSTLDVARRLFEADLCMEGINYGLAEIANTGGSVDSNEYVNQVPVAGGGGFTLIDGHHTYSCGGASIDASQLQPVQASTSLTDWSTIDVSTVYQAHQNALATMQSSLDSSAKEFVKDVLATRQGQEQAVPNTMAAIESAAAAYENTVQAQAGEKVGDMSQLSGQIVTNLQSEGWWMLGSWYQTFAQANTRLSAAISAMASVQGPTIVGSTGPVEVWQSAMSAYKVQAASELETNSSTLGAPPTAEQAGASTGSTESVLKKLFSPGQAVIQKIVSMGQERGQVNPLINFKNIGDGLMTTANMAIVATAGVQAIMEVKDGFSVEGLAARLVNVGTGAGDMMEGVWKTIYPYVFLIILALLMFGATLSVYLPMVPFVIWFGGIINWLVVVAEGIVAAPMWSMAHLGADGEGFGQRSMHGYLFLLNMCVRPFLMVIGFFIGGGVLVVAGTFVGPGFSLAVANAQFNSLTGIFSILFFLWVFTQLCLAVVHNSFNLILILPDQVINWVGGYAAARLGYDASTVGKGFEDGKESSGSRHERGSDKVQRASGRPDPVGDGMQA